MIVIKEQDAVYLASPMKFQNYSPNVRVDYSFEENGDMWHINDGHGTVVMVAASNNRIIDLIRYSDIFNTEFSKDGMNRVYASLKELLKGTNCYFKDGRFGGEIVVARGNRAYKIANNGAVLELGEIDCFDDDDERILASYEFCREISDPKERITTLYSRVSDLSSNQLFPIALINTKDDSYTLIATP
ncbi:MAG: hypothetical protein J6Q69_02275 [Clostridia bacterium]|nr:hypothetical protein [Clostridia bacterium]